MTDRPQHHFDASAAGADAWPPRPRATPEPPRAGDLVAAARALGPQIRACADRIEREQRLPEQLFEALADAGLFTMLVPAELGGAQTDPETFVRAIEEVARADGSAGWCVMLPATVGAIAGSLPPLAAEEMFGRDPRAYVVGTYVPAPAAPERRPDRAVAVEGGYRVSGRWSFASGCMHATWIGGAAIVHDGDEPRREPDGRHASRWFVFPAADCQIIDTWDVTGLRGSGSKDVAVVDVFVPAHRTLPRSSSVRPRHTDALYAFGAGAPSSLDARAGVSSPWAGFASIGFAAVSLGVARGALDAFAELASTKKPAGGAALLRDDPVVQRLFGRAEAQLAAGRAYVYANVRSVWDAVCASGQSTPEHQTLLRLASAHAAALAVEVVDAVWSAAGASAIFASSPLERRFRDVHVAQQNVALSPTFYGVAGRMFLGVKEAPRGG